MSIKGNFWLDLIEKEKTLSKEITRIVNRFIDKQFFDYSDMRRQIRSSVNDALEIYGVKHQLGIFDIDYELDLQYDSNYILTDFSIKYAYIIVEDFF